MEAIELNYQCEPLDDRDGFQLFVDGFFGDITVIINANDTFNINIDIFDEHYDIHYGFEKFPVAATLAYYKSVVLVLETEFCDDYELIKSQDYDTNRGLVHTVGYLCKEFDIDLINRVCETISNAVEVDGMDIFHSSVYSQALLETISNDEDYKENSGLQYDGDKLWLNPGYSMIFTSNISMVLPDVRFENFVEADDVYIGLKYAVVKNTALNKMAVIDNKYIKLFNRVSEEYEVGDIKYYSNFSHLVYAESENLKFVTVMLRINEAAIANEYELLSKQIYELKMIAPNIPIKISYDFSLLSDDEFEMLCFDLLNRMGFQNVKRIGKTNAPDGGRDIIADEEYKTLFKTERRKWIFQCKHSKKSLDRKEISEIGELLEEHNAQGYGLFCSGSITPTAVTRLESKKERVKGHVQYYGK